jgi:hypothetical protein
MRGRGLAWLAPLPLVAVGGAAAHAVVYRLAASPHAHAHGTHAPRWEVCAALCTAIALVALLVLRGSGAPVWLVALVPPGGFALQEQLSGAPHSGSLLLGLLLQIPVALAAVVLVRALLRTATALIRALQAEPRRRTPRIILRRPAWLALPPSAAALALGYGERGPPSLLPA